MPAHARPRRVTLTRGAQLLTATALAAGCLGYAVHGASTPSAAALGDAAGAAGLADASLARTDAVPRASRAGARTSRSPQVAVAAPELGAPVRRDVGVLGVTAVVKPDPVKTYAALAKSTPDASAGGTTPQPSNATTGGASPGAAAAGGSTTAYAAAGAALGLSPSAIAVYSAIRSTFGITNIGGLRPGDWGDHGTGHAVDVMITSSGQGDAVAGYAIANAGRLNIKYVIWQQRIWMPSTGSWKLMADRGSPTQNHMDHVHISVN